MATIRTQLVSGQRRIITKVVDGERRVSCSCCEEAECCMYPAAAVESNEITFEDLPDTLFFPFENLTYTKADAPFDFGGVLIYYEAPPFEGEDEKQAIYLEEGGTWNALGVLSKSPQCLIDEGEFGANDTFADTYTVTDNFTGRTGIVSRRSLCSWTGEDNLGCPMELLYETLPAPPRPGSQLKWTISIYDGAEPEPCEEPRIFIKTPHQNDPAGNYEDTITIS